MDFWKKRASWIVRESIARLPDLLRIVEENHGAGDLYLVGIRRLRVPLAERMPTRLQTW